ncbi:MAG TPA: pilus assembly protein PilP [Gammaproteobacteria bacterium]|nr:pilus assembly protein PilP [Gammaproteobacteria bacterium]
MRRLGAVAGAVLLLTGCSGGPDDPVSDLRAMVEKPTPPPNEEALPELPEPVQPTKVSFGALQRSPFSAIPSLRDAQESKPEYTGPKPIQDRERGPLEDFALGSLKIVGTMKLPGQGWRAYVSAPDGVVRTVEPGDYMGQQYGRIEQIGPNGVVLRELVPRGEGRWERRRRTVEIKSTGG